MSGVRGHYRRSYIVPHGNGFKYVRGVPKDLRHIEKKSAWVKCLGSVSRLEAETLAHGLAYQHGKRILAVRGLARGEPQPLPTTPSEEQQTGTPRTTLPTFADGPFSEPLRLRNGGRPHLMLLVDLWARRKSPRSEIGLARTRLCVRRFIDLVGDLEP